MKNTIILYVLLASTCILNGQMKSEQTDYFTNKGFGNAITGNAGEHYKGVTYVAYQGPLEDPYVAAYDHKNKKWIGPYKAGNSLLGKTAGKKIDNHGKPTLIIDRAGHIHLVFGGHGGTKDLGENELGNYHDGKQIHVVSKKPLDISSWEEVPNITPFGTYSQFLKMNNGDIYLFYRHGAHRSNWVYQVSTDNGRTFSPLTSIVLSKKTEGTMENPIIWDSWYLSFEHGIGNDIVVAFNYHVCKGPNHDGERHNAYFMKFNTDTKEWMNVKGENLQLPITKDYADKMTLVKNTGENWTHNGIATIDAQGMPHVSSYQGEDNGSKHGGPKVIQHYYWDGAAWQGGNTGLPVGAKGIMLAESKENVSFLLSSKEGTNNEVAWWKSNENSQGFAKDSLLLYKNQGPFSLSRTIRNAHPDALIIASQKTKNSDYTNMYLVGTNGPIKR